MINLSTASCQPRTCRFVILDTITMAEQLKLQYCRGCHTEAEEHRFDGFKQCIMCREKGLTRVRRKVTCDCGRTVLACSLKLHLRSLYHAEHTQPVPVAQAGKQPLPVPQQRPDVQQEPAKQLPPVPHQLQQQPSLQQQKQPKPLQLPAHQLPIKQQLPRTQQLPMNHLPANQQPPVPKKIEPVQQQSVKAKVPQQGGMKEPLPRPPTTSTAAVPKLQTASTLLPSSEARPEIKPAQR